MRGWQHITACNVIARSIITSNCSAGVFIRETEQIVLLKNRLACLQLTRILIIAGCRNGDKLSVLVCSRVCCLFDMGKKRELLMFFYLWAHGVGVAEVLPFSLAFTFG